MATTPFPRKYVKQDQALDSWAAIEPYFQDLLDRPIDTPDQLQQWLFDGSELCACISEVGTDRHVKMTCKTDDSEREKAYLDYVENIEPKCKPMWHKLNIRYTESPAAQKLPEDRYFVLDRALRARVKLFRDENIPLQVEEAKLEQKYQKITGAMTVHFDGKEQTLQQLAVYGESIDRAVREKAWLAGASRRLQDADQLDDLFDDLFRIRAQMAGNAGFANFRDYAFASKERFDYSPEDCLAFHEAVEKSVVPALRRMQETRKTALNVSPLRPWDLSVDPENKSPLRPFGDIPEFCNKTSAVFHRVDAELGRQFDEMRDQGYLDLDSRKGKAPGGYQATYDEARHPFIFMNAVGLSRDVRTLLHEGGHAFHSYASRDEDLIEYRNPPIEFCEVASMSMELLSLDYLDEFHDGDELRRAKFAQLEGIIHLFPWVARIDAFQHWMYTRPDHTREERRDYWLELNERFGGIEDYTDQEPVLERLWQRQLHLYLAPFYYIEYGIAQLGALQVWCHSRENRAAAIRTYRNGLSKGGSLPLPQLFDETGIRFDFTESTLTPLIDEVEKELEMLRPTTV
jgi:oligoendopeptidase F